MELEDQFSLLQKYLFLQYVHAFPYLFEGSDFPIVCTKISLPVNSFFHNLLEVPSHPQTQQVQEHSGATSRGGPAGINSCVTWSVSAAES